MKFEDYYVNDERIRIPFPESYADCVVLIRSDLYRVVGRDVGWRWFTYLLRPTFNKTLIWMRLASYRKGFFSVVLKFIYFRTASRCCVQIPTSIRVGFGFSIGHAIGIVINGKTIIGNNVNISQFCNIGTNHQTPAVIGDNVYIGPHTCIVEDVKIGSNSTIGAGAVVTHDVMPNETVAGVPAKRLNENNPGRYCVNRFPID